MLKKSLILLISASLLTGCMPGAGPKQTAGQIFGAATGAVIGSQFGHGRGKIVGAALGTLIGSSIGATLGRRLDERDRAMAHRVMVETLERAPDMEVRTWNNPNTNHRGNFRVTHTEEIAEDHLVCRDYVHTVIIDGKQEKVHGRACRDMRDRKGEWFVE